MKKEAVLTYSAPILTGLYYIYIDTQHIAVFFTMIVMIDE